MRLAARLFGLAEECVRKLPLFRLRARCHAYSISGGHSGRRRAAWRHPMTPSGTLSRDKPAGPSGRLPMADPPAAAPAGAAMSGQDALLATKLHLPRPPPGFVPRPRLMQSLSQGLARGRALICAPAGFGKTSLLADWAPSGGGAGGG